MKGANDEVGVRATYAAPDGFNRRAGCDMIANQTFPMREEAMRW